MGTERERQKTHTHIEEKSVWSPIYKGTNQSASIIDFAGTRVPALTSGIVRGTSLPRCPILHKNKC